MFNLDLSYARVENVKNINPFGGLMEGKEGLGLNRDNDGYFVTA